MAGDTKLMTPNTDALIQSLNTDQQQAVQAEDGPILVLAGAGSGKTRVLTHRIAYLILERGVAPWQILAMTFTKKAAGEMSERVSKLVQTESTPWIGTFHSIFSKILRYEVHHLNYTSDFVIYDSDDQVRLLKSIMDQQSISTQQYTPKSILSQISRAKNNFVSTDNFEKGAITPLDKTIAKLYRLYQLQLRANNAMDFDDLLQVPIELFNKKPEILEKYQNRFKYILVDEYQDTNRVQYELLKLLVKSHQNLFVVGDDDQSIYGWRGADIYNILNFEKDYKKTQTFRLQQNYRSTKNILAASNAVAAQNVGRKEKALWCDQEPGEKVDVYETLNEHAESLKIVNNLKQEVFKNKRSFRDFAILYRTNAQSRAIEDALRRNAISYIIVGGLRFYERKEIKDILAYLKVVVNPADSVSLKRIVNFPPRGIGNTTIQRLEAWALENNKSFFEAIQNVEHVDTLSNAAQGRVKTFYELIRKYQDLKDKLKADELLHILIDEIGFMRMYKEDVAPEAQARLENIQEIMNAVTEYVTNSEEPTLSGFLEEVALVTDIDSWDNHNNAVTLMTLHSAKGLEFPVVFIAGLEENLLPVARSLDNPAALEEERRLFYVGLTRAEKKLYISFAKQRSMYGADSYRIQSRFIEEMDPAVVKMHTLAKQRDFSTGRPRPNFRRQKQQVAFDQMPDYESESQEVEILTSGMQVEHPTFGKGRILEVRGQGAKQMLTILFENGQRKKLLTQYAHLTLLS